VGILKTEQKGLVSDMIASFEPTVSKIVRNVSRVILGKEATIRMVMAAFLSRGHVLLEDVPGVGKTVLGRALALSLGLGFKRIQFTPDLLPTDVTGLNIYDRNTGSFQFMEGPVFTDFLLADEINRATPRTQSALLEAMGENQISVDGQTHPLSPFFFVLATQNPIEYEGTFTLPEAQLDRFMVRVQIGYPDPKTEQKVILDQKVSHPLSALESVVDQSEVEDLLGIPRTIVISEAVAAYIVKIVHATRSHPSLLLGASPRGSIALMRIASVLAMMEGRDHMLPDDVKACVHSVLGHRVIQTTESKIRRETTRDILDDVLSKTAVV
jgi:MoxR-like ATPase